MQVQYDPVLKAHIRRIEHPKQTVVWIMFDNGYENLFFQDIESGAWIEQDLGQTELARQVGGSYIFSSTLNRKRRPLEWIHISSQQYTCEFGFYKYPTVDGYAFDIYYVNRRFMFTLTRLNNQQWYAIQYGGEADWDFRPDWVIDLPTLLEPYLPVTG